MKLTEGEPKPLEPKQLLQRAVGEVEELYVRENAELRLRHGRRLKSLLTEFKAAYPGLVPSDINVCQGITFISGENSVFNEAIQKTVLVGDRFWGEQGVNILGGVINQDSNVSET